MKARFWVMALFLGLLASCAGWPPAKGDFPGEGASASGQDEAGDGGVAAPMDPLALGRRIRSAESRKDYYEVALIRSAMAAGYERQGDLAASREALQAVSDVLSQFEYALVSAPEEIFAGMRPELPFVFQIRMKGAPVKNALFVVTYPRAARDGSRTIAQARLRSDESGLLRFRPPEIPFPGVQQISVAPSADPFLELLHDTSNSLVDDFIMAVEESASVTTFDARSLARVIPMGIVILETDLAGNPLDSNATAAGLLDDLQADGFQVQILPLNPERVARGNERDFLREFKADRQLADSCERVIFGRVALVSFEQNGDTFAVRVSGTLMMADVHREIVLYRSEIVKSSHASGSVQAMNAAFRQLGRSFARELSAQAPES